VRLTPAALGGSSLRQTQHQNMTAARRSRTKQLCLSSATHLVRNCAQRHVPRAHASEPSAAVLLLRRSRRRRRHLRELPGRRCLPMERALTAPWPFPRSFQAALRRVLCRASQLANSCQSPRAQR